MREKTCCFTGHRELDEQEENRLYPALFFAIDRLFKQGVIHFRCGGALGFDTMAALVVLDYQKLHPEIRLILDLPCASQSKHWSAKDRDVYEYLCERASEVHILAPHYYKGCMQFRNRHMVDRSAFVIAYQTKATGGSAYTVQYAKESHCEIIELS